MWGTRSHLRPGQSHPIGGISFLSVSEVDPLGLRPASRPQLSTNAGRRRKPLPGKHFESADITPVARERGRVRFGSVADDSLGMNPDDRTVPAQVLAGPGRVGRFGDRLATPPRLDTPRLPRLRRDEVVDHERDAAVVRDIAKLLAPSHVATADVDGVGGLVVAERDRVDLDGAVGLCGGQPAESLAGQVLELAVGEDHDRPRVRWWMVVPHAGPNQRASAWSTPAALPFVHARWPSGRSSNASAPWNALSSTGTAVTTSTRSAQAAAADRRPASSAQSRSTPRPGCSSSVVLVLRSWSTRSTWGIRRPRSGWSPSPMSYWMSRPLTMRARCSRTLSYPISSVITSRSGWTSVPPRNSRPWARVLVSRRWPTGCRSVW